jgi:hypothetical protein
VTSLRSQAIVIGIDAYARPDWALDSAVTDAVGFLKWILTAGAVESSDVTCLLSPVRGEVLPDGIQPERATSQAISDAFATTTRSTVERLYVYFAGHGISAPGLGASAGPVLVPDDVTDLEREHKKLHDLETWVDWLRTNGPEEQFWFVDACRNFVLDERLQAPPIAGAWMPRTGISARRQYALYAASPGQRASSTYGIGVFTSALLRALRFEDVRLDWRDDRYELRFGALADFVAAEVTAAIQGQGASTRWLQVPQPFTRSSAPNAVICSAPADAVARRKASIRVRPDTARGGCRLAVQIPVPARKLEFETYEPPLGDPVEIELPPNDYYVEVRGDGFETAGAALPLWRGRTSIDITVSTASAHEDGARLLTSSGDLETSVRWVDGTPVASGTALDLAVEPGVYLVRMERPDGPPREDVIAVTATAPVTWTPGPFETIPTAPSRELPDVSLGLRLAMCVQPVRSRPRRPRRLSQRPEGAVVVVTTDRTEHVFVYGASQVAEVRSFQLGEIKAVERRVHVPVGACHVEVELVDRAPLHFSIWVAEGRTTIVTLVSRPDGPVDVQQYVVPCSLEAMVRLERAQRRYVAGRFAQIDDDAIAALIAPEELDAVRGCVAGYTLAWRGDFERLRPLVAKMLERFPTLPDSHVLASFLDPDERHLKRAVKLGLPIFGAGLREVSHRYEQRGMLPPWEIGYRGARLSATPGTAAWMMDAGHPTSRTVSSGALAVFALGMLTLVVAAVLAWARPIRLNRGVLHRDETERPALVETWTLAATSDCPDVRRLAAKWSRYATLVSDDGVRARVRLRFQNGEPGPWNADLAITRRREGVHCGIDVRRELTYGLVEAYDLDDVDMTILYILRGARAGKVIVGRVVRAGWPWAAAPSGKASDDDGVQDDGVEDDDDID